MKVIGFLTIATGVFVSSCSQTPTSTDASPPGRTQNVRVSDEYSRTRVASYDAYHIDIPQHALALIRMKDGTRLPMLCRLESGSLRPLPQSVFSKQNTEAWYLNAEPKVTKGDSTGYALMTLDLRIENGVLVSGLGKAFRKMELKPKLAAGTAGG